MPPQKILEKTLVGAVADLPVERAEEAVDVLADSFFCYPVMRYVIGDVGGSYGGRLYKLIRFFVAARYCRDEPVLAVSDNGCAVGVAIMTPPSQKAAPSSLAIHREALWRELGKDARERYEQLGTLWNKFTVPEPHHHLNMIGVLNSYGGKGVARQLLDAAHEISATDPASTGVSLTTEDENNVALYEHFGYKVIGHFAATNELESWVMFRPNLVRDWSK